MFVGDNPITGQARRMDFNRLVEARTVFRLGRWCPALAPIISTLYLASTPCFFQVQRASSEQSDHSMVGSITASGRSLRMIVLDRLPFDRLDIGPASAITGRFMMWPWLRIHQNDAETFLFQRNCQAWAAGVVEFAADQSRWGRRARIRKCF